MNKNLKNWLWKLEKTNRLWKLRRNSINGWKTNKDIVKTKLTTLNLYHLKGKKEEAKNNYSHWKVCFYQLVYHLLTTLKTTEKHENSHPQPPETLETAQINPDMLISIKTQWWIAYKISISR